MSTQISYPNHRHYPRKIMDLEVRFGEENYLSVCSTDISECGIFIPTSQLLTPKSTLVMVVTFLKLQCSLVLEGIVVRVQNTPGKTGIGIEFIRFAQKHKEMLHAILYTTSHCDKR